MAYCKHCGNPIDDNAMTCSNCGANQDPQAAPAPAPAPAPTPAPVADNGGFLWGLLGCCIPIVGLILFLVWKDQKPKTAKAAGVGALVTVICSVVMYILTAVLGVAGAVL